MPTPEVTGYAASQSEEIKKIAREYAEYMCPIDSDYYDDAKEMLKWLSKDYCIVPKSKLRKWQGIVEDALKADPVMTEPAFRFMWERLFGTELFNEEKE